MPLGERISMAMSGGSKQSSSRFPSASTGMRSQTYTVTSGTYDRPPKVTRSSVKATTSLRGSANWLTPSAIELRCATTAACRLRAACTSGARRSMASSRTSLASVTSRLPLSPRHLRSGSSCVPCSVGVEGREDGGHVEGGTGGDLVQADGIAAPSDGDWGVGTVHPDGLAPVVDQ